MTLPPLSAAAATNPAAQRVLDSLNAITSPCSLDQILTQILLHSLLPNTSVISSFIFAAAAFRRLPAALRLFSLLRRPHTFVCHSLLRALHLHCRPRRALRLFATMHRLSIPFNRYSFPHALSHLSELRELPASLPIHALVIKSGHYADLYVANSLLKTYSVCGEVSSAEKLFDEMPFKEVIAWSTMIMAYGGNGQPGEALVAFERMQFAGVAPNRVTMVSALSACSDLGAADTGVWIHGYASSKGWEMDVVLGTSLIDMYGKCGKVEEGIHVFKKMKERNSYTWNSLLGGLAVARRGEEAVRFLNRMEEEGVKPDHVTLTAVLSACSRSGMVETGRRVFDSIAGGQFGFGPNIKHFGCIVDLLGRAGLLDSAMEYIETMPFEANVVIWGSVLGACRAQGKLKLGEAAAGRLVALEPENVAHYVVLSSVYADMGRWRDVEAVRAAMKEMRMRKEAGSSSCVGDDPLLALSSAN